MASSSGKDHFKVDEEDDGQRRNTAAQDRWSNLLHLLVGLCCSGPDGAASPPSSSSWYHSTRIQHMIDQRGQLSMIESSKPTWSEVDESMPEIEQSREENRKYFEELKRRKYVREGDKFVATERAQFDKSLFDQPYYCDNLVVGEKVAEGGQGEIYRATIPHSSSSYLVKVFKAGSLLRELEKQWPPAMLKYHQRDEVSRWLPRIIEGATLLGDERFLDRFAFVMVAYWGDLRTLIDKLMMDQSHNQGPPFTLHQVLVLMWNVVEQMSTLHGLHSPILHNDLKAANLLVLGTTKGEPSLASDGAYLVNVADYECSVGVVGTGLWRAPEILQQLKDNERPLKFIEKCDVYSFGMTCYELVTGRIPFEDHSFKQARDLVLRGERPELPFDLDPKVKGIIISCWDAKPSQRPSFEDIKDVMLKDGLGTILKWSS